MFGGETFLKVLTYFAITIGIIVFLPIAYWIIKTPLRPLPHTAEERDLEAGLMSVRFISADNFVFENDKEFEAAWDPSPQYRKCDPEATVACESEGMEGRAITVVAMILHVREGQGDVPVDQMEFEPENKGMMAEQVGLQGYEMPPAYEHVVEETEAARK